MAPSTPSLQQNAREPQVLATGTFSIETRHIPIKAARRHKDHIPRMAHLSPSRPRPRRRNIRPRLGIILTMAWIQAGRLPSCRRVHETSWVTMARRRQCTKIKLGRAHLNPSSGTSSNWRELAFKQRSSTPCRVRCKQREQAPHTPRLLTVDPSSPQQ